MQGLCELCIRFSQFLFHLFVITSISISTFPFSYFIFLKRDSKSSVISLILLKKALGSFFLVLYNFFLHILQFCFLTALIFWYSSLASCRISLRISSFLFFLSVVLSIQIIQGCFVRYCYRLLGLRTYFLCRHLFRDILCYSLHSSLRCFTVSFL